MIRRFAILALTLAAADVAVAAQCVNKFVARRERQYQQVTLLTGKLTFQEAQKLASDIQSGKAERLAWVDDKGKAIASQLGELKVVRPMPVGCDGRSSGVILTVNLMTVNPPVKKMLVKMPDATVAFEEQ
jgi:hypothetical protein